MLSDKHRSRYNELYRCFISSLLDAKRDNNPRNEIID